MEDYSEKENNSTPNICIYNLTVKSSRFDKIEMEEHQSTLDCDRERFRKAA